MFLLLPDIYRNDGKFVKTACFLLQKHIVIDSDI